MEAHIHGFEAIRSFLTYIHRFRRQMYDLLLSSLAPNPAYPVSIEGLARGVISSIDFGINEPVAVIVIGKEANLLYGKSHDDRYSNGRDDRDRSGGSELVGVTDPVSLSKSLIR